MSQKIKIGQLVYIVMGTTQPWPFKVRVVSFDEETICVQMVFPSMSELFFVEDGKIFNTFEDAKVEADRLAEIVKQEQEQLAKRKKDVADL